ncbi:MAG: carbohydrate ABC transporter permease, partial [Bacillota bacterium]|nr:carbohydrate ABC transporter permease [Bacillota bacterium]
MDTKTRIVNLLTHGILLAYSFVVIYPLFIMVITSLKTNLEVMTRPFSLPQAINLKGYETVLNQTNFLVFYRNSIVVTVVSLFLIIVVSTLAAYAL